MNINSSAMSAGTGGRGRALRRRSAILQLVQAQPVRSQHELGQLLRRRGFAVAQPTLSRDIAELGLARSAAGYAVAPPLSPTFMSDGRRQDSVDRAIAHGVLSVQTAGSLVVVKTPPAGAHPVARALDEAGLAGIVGTIAGDDTVFVATPDA